MNKQEDLRYSETDSTQFADNQRDKELLERELNLQKQKNHKEITNWNLKWNSEKLIWEKIIDEIKEVNQLIKDFN